MPIHDIMTSLSLPSLYMPLIVPFLLSLSLPLSLKKRSREKERRGKRERERGLFMKGKTSCLVVRKGTLSCHATQAKAYHLLMQDKERHLLLSSTDIIIT